MNTIRLTDEEITRVKGLGFLRDKTTEDCFNCRVITRNGKITAEEARIISEAAKLYGNGEITMTARLTLEIQKVPYGNIDKVIKFLNDHGLETGGTGPKVRPIVSCKGTTCQYGLIDTFSLSEEIHHRFYKGYHNVILPHKFKIAVGGCPNNCMKPDINDLGIIGQRKPVINLEKCKNCKVCNVEKTCYMKAIKVQNNQVMVDYHLCNNCGLCIKRCPFHAVEPFEIGYKVYIGGRWGKVVDRGLPLNRIFTDKEEVLNVVEKSILLYKEQGIKGERFNDTIKRIGFEKVEQQLLSDDLLIRKNEILGK